MTRASHSKDFDVRAAVITRLLVQGVPRSDIRHELTLDTSSSGGRVDVAVLRDAMILAIEIKSGSDKLDRLTAQMEAYKRSFDHVRVVLDARHAEAASRLFYFAERTVYDHEARRFSGIDPDFLTIRRWERSSATSTVDVASLLWRSEACWVAGQLQHTCKTRVDAIDWMRENAALRDVRPLAIEALRGRTLSRWEDAFWTRYDALPEPAATQAEAA